MKIKPSIEKCDIKKKVFSTIKATHFAKLLVSNFLKGSTYKCSGSNLDHVENLCLPVILYIHRKKGFCMGIEHCLQRLFQPVLTWIILQAGQFCRGGWCRRVCLPGHGHCEILIMVVVVIMMIAMMMLMLGNFMIMTIFLGMITDYL